MHIQDPEQRKWIQDKIEVGYAKTTREEQLRILRRLNAAEAFETFLQTKFVGQKRFSLEGGESVIALLDRILSRAAEDDLDEVCIGMPHRGRLNVLANIAGKSYGQIFREFEGKQDPRSVQGSGDVKYHLGTEGTFTAEGGKTTKVYLAANPSHLEAVNPVLEGIVRAKQDRLDLAGEDFTVLPVLMHGDAAFAGQGVVAETLNLSQLRGYRTGGTVHVVINNQVGFTTSPSSSRSSTYSTDVARMIQAPIFHVNGDDPEACVRVAELAYEFRKEFHKDVVIDMVCYRRRGHNEGDDPSMTQPLMYNLIEAKRCVRKLYTESLIGRGDITVEDAEAALRDYQQQLERVFVETKAALKEAEQEAADASYSGTDVEGHTGLEPPAAQARNADATAHSSTETAISTEVLHRHRRRLRRRRPRASPSTPSCARCSRSGPRACARAASTGASASSSPSARCSWRAPRCASPARTAAAAPSCSATPCSSTSRTPPSGPRCSTSVRARASSGSTTACCPSSRPWASSTATPSSGPTPWCSGRRSSATSSTARRPSSTSSSRSSEQKWGQRSSVVLLLPHGYEGQGPDHSSARIERFLTMCAENNMTVAYPSTPASYFHLLRRQAYARPRRPLIVFTPKSMLRLKAASSAVEDFTTGTLPPGHARPRGRHQRQVTRVLIAAGKVVYDLARRARRSAATPRRRSCGSSSTTRSRRADLAARAGEVPRRRGRRRAGRAEEPGRLAVPRAQPARGARRPGRAPPAARHLARRVGLARHRLDQEAPGRAGRPRRAGVRPLTAPRTTGGGAARRGAVQVASQRVLHGPRHRGAAGPPG